MSRWVWVAPVDACPVGSGIEVVAEGRLMAVFCTAQGLFALDGVCPHQGGPLGKGSLEGCIVTCPWHGWQFDVTTGRNQITSSIAQPRFPARIDGDGIWIQLDDPAPT
jgi:nitrite reductase (NADH) small subunit